jgi:putative transcriptional regulator
MHDLTQEQLAKKLGVTRVTINAIENQRYDPSLSLAFQMTGFFEVRIEEIFIVTRSVVDNMPVIIRLY